METSKSSRFPYSSYQAVPLENEAPESVYPLSHIDSPRATSTGHGAQWYSFNSSNFGDAQRLHLSLGGPPDTLYESGSEVKGTAESSSISSDKRSTKSDKRRERWWRWKDVFNRWWIWELLGVTLAMACFVALVVVLRYSAGKEPTRWIYNKLTLNGLIALLSTFMRASMMLGVGASLGQIKWNHFSHGSQNSSGKRLEDLDTFDQASRGPLGSIALLFARTKPHIGLIGAIITILTLVFDTFAQEVIIVRYDNRPGINGTFVGPVARSEEYDIWTKVNLEVEWTTDTATVAAEYNGIFNYENIVPPEPRCSTGNCTWPVVPSLAVCGTCTDLTSHLTRTCIGHDANATSTFDTRNCSYHLPVGKSYLLDKPGYHFWTTADHSSNGVENTLAYIVAEGYVIPAYNKSDHVYLDQWLMINATRSPVTANACALWFCVQAYETSVKNGIPTQKIVGNWSATDYRPLHIDTNGFVNFTGIPSDIQLNATYSVSQNSLIAFGQNPIFTNANVTYGTDASFFYTYSSTVVRSLFNIPNYDSWIDQFALSMSNNVRKTGASYTPEETYAGQVLASVPYVQVRWPWLAFPAAMVAASLLFLVLSVWQTHHFQLPPWKSDAVALLLASADEEIHRESASKWRIEKQKVWLDPRKSGAVFRKLAVNKA